MLRNKSTKVFSETNGFFTSSDKGIFRIMELYRSLKLETVNIGAKDFPQASYRKCDLLLGIMLFPLFSIKNVRSYCSHTLSNILEAQKNTFYRFKNDSHINWRNILNACNACLFKQIDMQAEKQDNNTRCLIVDDTDFEKSTYKTEHVGKIWSHVLHCRFFGFKGLFLGYWDGKSFFTLDFSLHKERGKNKKRPFGLTSKQKKKQFSKVRDKHSAGRKREQELTNDKVSMAIKMVKSAIRRKLVVDYLLMDSWFFCEAFLVMLTSLKKKVDVVCMIKMAKAKYEYKGKRYTAKELAELLKRRKQVKWNKTINLYCAEIVVDYKSTPLKLYFCKNSKRGKWHLLGTTDIKLGILKAYEIYSIRWSIEVFFKESKQYFGLGKCQSQDFDAQIADVTITMLVYNVFSLAKRFESYETLGGLFEHTRSKGAELTIARRIWGFILELLQIIAEFIDGNFNELIINLMKKKPEENKIFRLIESQLSEAA